MDGVSDWHDIVRVIAFLVNVYAFSLLICRFRSRAEDWNVKTKDLWYALLAWTAAGATLNVQSILLDRPLTPGFVLIVAAALVTGKGVHRKGSWGASRV